MIYTSYYANPNLDPSTQILVQISNSAPYTCNFAWDTVYPTWDLVEDLKSGKITEIEYRVLYRNLLVSRAYKLIYELDFLIQRATSESKDIVFLCYESPEKFCHRHILVDYLNEIRNYNITEL